MQHFCNILHNLEAYLLEPNRHFNSNVYEISAGARYALTNEIIKGLIIRLLTEGSFIFYAFWFSVVSLMKVSPCLTDQHLI